MAVPDPALALHPDRLLPADPVDDTRALCSIPARHDMSRIDRGHLARLVAEHRIDEDEAVDTAVELVAGLPPYVDLAADDVASYRAALLERFANPRIRHQLDQIATDGSQKLPVRILPALRRERARGHLADGAVRVLAAWLCTLRGHGAPVTDARADEIVPLAGGPLAEAARRVLDCLDPELAGDRELVEAVTATAAELAGS